MRDVLAFAFALAKGRRAQFVPGYHKFFLGPEGGFAFLDELIP